MAMKWRSPSLPTSLVWTTFGWFSSRGEARLVEEHPDEVRVLGEVRPELLDDEELVEPPGPAHEREVDDAHAAARELGDEAVASEVTDLRLRRYRLPIDVLGRELQPSPLLAVFPIQTIAQNGSVNWRSVAISAFRCSFVTGLMGDIASRCRT